MSTVQQSFDLAVQHHQAGRLADAEVLYRQVLAAQPNHPDAVHMLGVIAYQCGHAEIATQLIRQALVLAPRNPIVHCNLGLVRRMDGFRDEAIACYQRALQLDPRYAEAHNNLGIGLAELGRLEEAIAAFRRALEFKPDYPDVLVNLGNALKEHDQLDEAIAVFRRALELWPNSVSAHYNFGNALRYRGEIDAALTEFRHALQLNPGDVLIMSTIILALQFHPGDVTAEIAAEQERWNRQYGDRLKRFIQPHPNDRNPERRLRIGYVSPDFREHVVGRNLLPLFRNHRPREVEIVCYSGVLQPDATTEEFQKYAHQWRNTVGMSDEALAAAIRQDAVDILVDLSQHTPGNRLPVFARQPAPVQVSFAGYPASTGVEAIGYRLSDRWLEADASEIEDGRSEMGRRSGAELRTLNSDLRSPNPELRPAERVFPLSSFWCYDPCGIDLPVNALPAGETGGITFASLNSFFKINEPVLKLWARVLQSLPDSRLLLLSDPGGHRQWVLRILQQGGVDPHRVEFLPRQSRPAYFETYHRVDLILDPFPYGGHSTNLDALWMGVPVISFAGKRAVSRAGLSQMSNLGLRELVAFSEDEYVAIASGLPHDRPRLAELRRTLRPRLEASPLMDAPGFARQIEAAYRAMWRRWSAGA